MHFSFIRLFACSDRSVCSIFFCLLFFLLFEVLVCFAIGCTGKSNNLQLRYASALYTFADPYLNIDAGTMSPFEHGEVFVLDDGGEVSFFQ